MTSPTSPARRAAWRRLARRARPYWPDALAFAASLAWAALAALLAVVLAGCGGGVGTEGTGSFASGPITGFGSIVVNGVHYDPGAARIEADDGQTADLSALQLGVMVQVNAGPVSVGSDGVARATASRVRYLRSLVGPIAAIDLAAARVTVLGQPVAVSASTVFGDGIANGLAGLAAGQPVVVFGDFDGSTYQATRIALAPAASANLLRGPVTAIDAGTKTFTIGSQTYSYAAIADPASLAVGATVDLALPGAPDSEGRWEVDGARRADDPAPANASVDLTGTVDALVSPTRFVVDNRSVDASQARIDPGLAPGVTVHVVGTASGGVVVASRVEVSAPGGPRTFELIGPVTRLDQGARQFVVRGTAVSYADPGVVFDQGSAADLSVGQMVQVDGVLASDGRSLRATSIRFVH